MSKAPIDPIALSYAVLSFGLGAYFCCPVLPLWAVSQTETLPQKGGRPWKRHKPWSWDFHMDLNIAKDQSSSLGATSFRKQPLAGSYDFFL